MKIDSFYKSYHTVSSYELDSFGHVNNAVFLNYLEKARCDFLKTRGLSFNDFLVWKRYPVVIKSILEYKYPAITDDKLLIKGWVSHHSYASFTMTYEIVNEQTKKIILTGTTRHVFIDENNKPTPIPEEFKQKFIR